MSHHFFMRLVLCGAVIVSLSQLARAEQSSPLDRATAAYEQVDFENTLVHAEEALAQGGHGRAQLTRVYELIGISATAMGDEERARQAYVRMLALDPSASLERSLSPRFRGPFLEARGYWAARTERLGVEVVLARRRGAVRVDLQDPLGMTSEIVLRARADGADGFVESRQLAAERVYVDFAGAEDDQPIEYVLRLLDEHGNSLMELGHEDAPEILGQSETVTAEQGLGPGPADRPSVTSRPWFWAVMGVVAAVAVGGAIAAGVVLSGESGRVGVETDVTIGVH